MTFSVETTLVVLSLGAACLAAWVAIRYPGFGPTTLWGALLHVLIAFGVAELVPPGIDLLGRIQLGSVAAAVMLVVLPGLTYMFLALFWLVRAIQGATSLRGG